MTKNTIREKLFRMVSVGVIDEPVNQAYDIISTGALLLNLAASILLTFDHISKCYGGLLLLLESATVLFFGIDYVLRLITANYLYPDSNERDSLIRYIFSAAGIIDLLSFLPYYLPVFFPAGLAVFRMFRVVRIFRLFRINDNETPKIENEYKRAVREEGNVVATDMIEQVFNVESREWRGFPKIPNSILEIKDEFSDFNAREKYDIEVKDVTEAPKGCICGPILRGLARPEDCKLFRKACNPLHPIGACMVSKEGTCNIAHRYSRG